MHQLRKMRNAMKTLFTASNTARFEQVSIYFMVKMLIVKRKSVCKYLYRYINIRTVTILGIETSCDDTGVAIVNDDGKVLANELYSQQEFHTKYGGIIPPRAQNMHRACIANNFERCLLKSNMAPEKLDAIAVTTCPGLPLSLLVGLRYAKHIARYYSKPIIPVHHMEAHALQARMEYNIPYPYLSLLISGGHCQLAFVKSPHCYLLFGETLDDAPGETLDKIARRLRLSNIPLYRSWSGGKAIEHAAHLAQDPEAYKFPLPLAQQHNCNFSFAGIKNNCFRAIHSRERLEGTSPDSIISNYADLCAGVMIATSRHLVNRTQHAIEYCLRKKNSLFGSAQPVIVVSGGVATNDTIFSNIEYLGHHYHCITYRPSKKYCSDNGVMIAWNAIEKLKDKGVDSVCWNYDSIQINGKIKLGEMHMT